MRYIVYLILFISLISCGFVDNRYDLDLSSEKTFTLTSKNNELPSGFRFHANGNYSGEGTLVLLLEGKPYKTKIIKGDVDFTWSGDWYYPKMRFIYKVKKKGIGKLKIRYKIAYAI